MSSKREHQQLVREQKQQAAARRQARINLLWKSAAFGLLPLFLLLVIYTLLTQEPTYSPIEVGDNDHLRGEADRPVTMTLYADFQCPACAQEFQLISRAWPQLSDKARLIFRHYPLTDTHEHAWTASLYAEAAGRQGRFWEMHDLIFASQGYWSGLVKSDVVSEFDGFAGQLGLDLTQLQADMASDSVIEKIRADQRGGIRSGVRSTPTLFINGEIVVVNSLTRLLELVNQAAARQDDS